jgi:ATP-dependent Clp protease ATP-binding subunit ClpC
VFERFTDRARKSVVISQESARELNHNYIGTEHILLGVASDIDSDGVAFQALQAVSLDATMVREKIIEIIGLGESPITGHIPFTPRAKKILEISLRESIALGHGFIDSFHILLALTQEKESVSSQVFSAYGISQKDLRNTIFEILSSGGEDVSGSDSSEGEQSGGGGVFSRVAKGFGIGEKTNGLEGFSTDMTALAEAEKLDPVFGREEQIERLLQVLSRRTKNNPVLIGEPGVGKTAIVEGLAQKIAAREVPTNLESTRIISLDLGSLVAGARYRGDFEERLKKILKQIKQNPNIILFIDEIHTLVGAGAAEGAIDASSMLKPLLARGEIKVIGATTLDEYRILEKDAALERRFAPIDVPAPNVDETAKILFTLRDRYETHHKVQYTDQALYAAAKLADRYINDRFLPDKAIDVLDEAGSRVQMGHHHIESEELSDLDGKIAVLVSEKIAAIEVQDFEKAAEVRDQQKSLEEEKQNIITKFKEEVEEIRVVSETDIADVIELITGVPVSQMTEAEITRLKNMSAILNEHVIGQEEAIETLSRAIRRTRAGLKDPKRPSGSFIFAGPSGVGKTELCKQLAKFLFGDEDSLISIDMSEYSERHTASRLFGSPPGFVGYEEGGQLTEKIRRKPFSILLLDEVEKAHPEIFNSFLQVLDEGRLTDAQGRAVDFKNTVIIMTTNLGSRGFASGVNVGFGSGELEEEYARMKSLATRELKEHFRPEFLNRIDETIVFKPLSRTEILQIVDLMLDEVKEKANQAGWQVSFTNETKEFLADKGWDKALGARPLRRAVQQYVEDELSEYMLFSSIQESSDSHTIQIDVGENDKLKVVPLEEKIEII